MGRNRIDSRPSVIRDGIRYPTEEEMKGAPRAEKPVEEPKEKPEMLSESLVRGAKRLNVRTYDSVNDDTFVVVKTGCIHPEQRPRPHDEPYLYSVVMRRKDSQLYVVSDYDMRRIGITAQPGHEFRLRMITPTGHDEDMKFVVDSTRVA